MTRGAIRGRRPGANDTRGRILETARSLFARHGVAGTSIRMIARELGITDPAIYYHFPTKQAILESLLVEPGYGTLPLHERPLSHETMVDQVMHLFGWWIQQPDFTRMLLREQLAGDHSAVGYLASGDDMWAAEVAAPLRDLLGARGDETARVLKDMLTGVLWDALLTYSDEAAEVMAQEYFQKRVRAMVELAITGAWLGEQ